MINMHILVQSIHPTVVSHTPCEIPIEGPPTISARKSVAPTKLYYAFVCNEYRITGVVSGT